MVTAGDHSIAEVANLKEPLDLAPYIEYLEDPDYSITEAEIRSGKYATQWQRNSDKFFVARNLKSRYWFRFTIQWDAEIATESILAINNHPGLLNHIRMIIPVSDMSNRTEIAGHMDPYNLREVRKQQFAFRLDLIPHRPLTIIGSVDNNKAATPSVLPIYLVAETGYPELNYHVMGILIAFYAIMGSLLLYNSCLYLSLRQPVYGLYVLFLLIATLMCAILDGSTARWLMPNSPLLNNWISHLNGIATPLIYLCFVVQALDKINFWPRFKYVFHTLLATGFVFLGHNVFSTDTYLASQLVQAYSGIIIPVVLILIIGAMYHRIVTAGYLLFAEIVILFGASIFMLMGMGMIPVNEFTLWGLHWGSAGEALLLSFAVAARTNIIIEEKFKAQELAYLNERKALAALEIATQTKNQFLATVSHELRTPLNSIIGFGHVLLDDQNIQGASRDYTRTIVNNGKQLLAVINDVLNLSLIDSNRLAITQQTVDLRRLVQGLEVKYRLTAEKKQLAFDVLIANELPHSIEIDDEHLMQILKQLLDNAFKFTHQGRINLHVEIDNSTQPIDGRTAQAHLLFTLTDTGIGIAADNLALIFDPFTQADSSNARRYSGTGVGLFIAKSVCEKMGGTLSVESTQGVGSRFNLRVPYQQLKQETSVTEYPSLTLSMLEKPQFHGKVLYTEDNPDNRQLVQLLIETTGAEVTLAENGQEAIELISNSVKPFDLVLMDLQMPVMDGYEATAILQRTGCRIPIIACSASALAEIESSSDISFDGYLGKPIDKMSLYAVLREFLAAS